MGLLGQGMRSSAWLSPDRWLDGARGLLCSFVAGSFTDNEMRESRQAMEPVVFSKGVQAVCPELFLVHPPTHKFPEI